MSGTRTLDAHSIVRTDSEIYTSQRRGKQTLLELMVLQSYKEIILAKHRLINNTEQQVQLRRFINAQMDTQV